jgi:hypothetical protein
MNFVKTLENCMVLFENGEEPSAFGWFVLMDLPWFLLMKTSETRDNLSICMVCTRSRVNKPYKCSTVSTILANSPQNSSPITPKAATPILQAPAAFNASPYQRRKSLEAFNFELLKALVSDNNEQTTH